MKSILKDCYNCAIETMQVLNKIYNHLLSFSTCLGKTRSSNVHTVCLPHKCLEILVHGWRENSGARTGWAVDPSTREAQAGGSVFEANLVYRSSSRTVRTTQKNSCFRKTKEIKPLGGAYQPPDSFYLFIF